MSIVLRSTVYTADRGYAWSNVPKGTTANDLEKLLNLATGLRPEFPTTEDVTQGAVSDGNLIAVFSIRTVPDWDSEGRSADYVAFALLDREEVGQVDFKALLENRFFQVPVRNPPPFMMYEGPESQTPPLNAAGRLVSHNHIEDLDFSAAGVILSLYGDKSSRWTFLFNPETGLTKVKTAPWNIVRKAH